MKLLIVQWEAQILAKVLNDCPDNIAGGVNLCNDQVADPDHGVLFLEF